MFVLKCVASVDTGNAKWAVNRSLCFSPSSQESTEHDVP
jgi:hypothetical protein